MLRAVVPIGVIPMAAQAVAAERPITVSGCTSGGIEGCIFLNKPGQRYALLVNAPKPALGRGVTVKGVLDDGPSLCMFSPAIKVQRWN
jgi:hypothetical protein